MTDLFLSPQAIIDTGATKSFNATTLPVKLLITQYDSDYFLSFEQHINTLLLNGSDLPTINNFFIYIPRFCIKWRKINLLHNLDYFKTKLRDIYLVQNASSVLSNIYRTIGQGPNAVFIGYNGLPMFDKVDIEDDAFNDFSKLIHIKNNYFSGVPNTNLQITSKTTVKIMHLKIAIYQILLSTIFLVIVNRVLNLQVIMHLKT